MIIIDTNVLSEMLRPAPDEAVSDWLAAQPVTQLFTTSVTEAEIRYGVARLPEGQRKGLLQSAVEGLFTEDLSGRILPFDTESAKAYAEIVSQRDRTDARSVNSTHRSVPSRDQGAQNWQRAISQTLKAAGST